MKKRVIAAVMAAALSLGLWGCKTQPDTVVYVENVETLMALGSTGDRDTFPGKVVSENLAKIHKDPEQTVAQLYVEQGQDVAQGELLFAYDSEAIALQLSKQELELDRLNNTVTTLKSQIKQLETEQKKASKDEQLSYSIEIQDRQAQLAEAEYNVSYKKKEIEQTKSSLNNAKIYAPVAGRVVSISDSGVDLYGNAQPYITIQQTGSYRIEGTINELNIGAVQEGSIILISSRTDDRVWTGTVTSIDLETPSQTNLEEDLSGTYDSMTSSSSYHFYVDPETTDGLILGQHVYLEVYVATPEKSGLWLRDQYLLRDQDGNIYVWAANEEDRLERRIVTLGDFDQSTGAYEILSGLTGEDYIAFPAAYCQEGAPVQRQDRTIPEVPTVPEGTEETQDATADPAQPTDQPEQTETTQAPGTASGGDLE